MLWLVNVKLLIDAIVQQTMVLIAQLATAAGGRAPLSHVANQVFLSLVGELDRQGVSRKVASDMFGVALRTYQKKTQRLSESATERGRSLWEAMLEFLRDRPVTSRSAVLQRFRHDEESVVRGILRDLVASGLLFQTGSGNSTAYRAAQPDEMGVSLEEARDSAATLVWINTYRFGPLTQAELATQLRLDEDAVEPLLAQLVSDGRVTREERGDQVRFWSDTFVVEKNEPVGFEAALFDHYQALVATLCRRLRGEEAAGSTYSLDVWPEHPFYDEAVGLLAELRDRTSALRERIDNHNATAGKPDRFQRVVFYMGQNVQDDHGGKE